MNQIIRTGFKILSRHSQLMLVVILLVVFPALFIFTLQQFTALSQTNTNTVLLQEINSLQDVLENLVSTKKEIDPLLKNLVEDNSQLQKIRVVKEVDGELIVVNDNDESSIGSVDDNQLSYKTALVNPGQTFIIKPLVNGEELTRAYRAIKSPDNTNYYILTEYNYSLLDSVLDKRVQDTYLVLSLIFLFIIILAYWISRQINYEKLFQSVSSELKERDLFIDSLAHEFRTPLTAIKGYASLVIEPGSTTDEKMDYAQKIKDSSNRLITLVNDFLQAAHIKAGKLDISKTDFDANLVIEKVIAEMQPLAHIRALTLKTELPNSPTMIKTDAGRLGQILTNIISNSIKYTAEGEVKITLRKNLLNTTFIIADSGFGISAEDQRKLFQPFSRVGTDEQKSNVVGSGLGMWITKELVAQLEGEISLESIKGVGTHVILRFKNKYQAD